jgi:hypothetical protein
VINSKGSIISSYQFGTTNKVCFEVIGENEIFFIEINTKETKRKIIKLIKE